MKKFNELLEKRWFANTFAICAGIAFYLLLTHLGDMTGAFSKALKIISPIIVGIIIAYLIDPVVKFLENRVFKKLKKEETKHTISVILGILFFLVLIVLFFVALVPSLIESVSIIISNIDTYTLSINSFFEWINSLGFGVHLDLSSVTGYLEGLSKTLAGYISTNISTILNTSKSVGNSVFNVVIGFILGIYFLLGKKSLISSLTKLRGAAITEETLKRHNTFFSRCHEILIRYIGCDLLDGLIVGVINAIVMLILRMPYVALISVIAGVTNLIPTFGPVIGAVIGAFILVLIKPAYALWFLIITIVLQAVDAYIIKPKLFGGSLGIPAVWTLISIIIGGKLLGIAGILLAIPFAAIISFLYQESFLPWLKDRTQKRAARADK